MKLFRQLTVLSILVLTLAIPAVAHANVASDYKDWGTVDQPHAHSRLGECISELGVRMLLVDGALCQLRQKRLTVV